MALIQGTNIDTNALAVTYSANTVAELRRRTVLLMATDRTWDGAGRTQSAVPIRVPDAQTDNVERTDITGSAVNRAKVDRDWAGGRGITSAQVVLGYNNEFRRNSIIGQLDQNQSPINELNKEQEEIVGELARDREQALADYINGLATRSTITPAAADYPNAAGTASNGNGGKVYAAKFGDATDHVNPDGSVTTPKAGGLVEQVLEEGHAILTDNNYLQGGGITSTGDTSDMVYAFMHPRLAKVLIQSLRSQGLYLERLTADVLGLDSMGPRVSGSRAYAGTYAGITIMTSTLPTFRATASTDWPVWVMTNKAIAWTDGQVVTQVLTPESNQLRPVYEIKHQQFAGYQLVQKEAILKLSVASK